MYDILNHSLTAVMGFLIVFQSNNIIVIDINFFIALCRSGFVQQRDQWNLQHQKCGTAKSLYQNVYGTIMLLSVLYLLRSTMDDKSVETLSSKIRFLSVLVAFCPLPP